MHSWSLVPKKLWWEIKSLLFRVFSKSLCTFIDKHCEGYHTKAKIKKKKQTNQKPMNEQKKDFKFSLHGPS